MVAVGRNWLMVTGLMVAATIGVTAGDARAQGFGVGARMVFVTGADSPLQETGSSSTTTLRGVFARLRASSHMGLEVAYDWRTARDAENTIEVKTTPITVSGLFYLLKGPVAPYIVVGAGWYKTRVDLLGDAAAASDTMTSAETTKFGYHSGIGGELHVGKHASVFVDYRYTFVNLSGFGGILGTATSLLTGGVGPLLSSMTGVGGNAVDGTTTNPNVSHLGSMWTTGMMIYF